MQIFLQFIALFGIGALVACILGVRQTYSLKNPYGLTPLLLPYGAFVWGDAVLFGLFWTGICAVSYFSANTRFFLVASSIFWMVRSAGEVVYWLLQQFATTKRDLPETLTGHSLFPGESIWFAYQVGWQIAFIIATCLLLHLLGFDLL